jgi:ATP-binding protein involved in chromosome partitioning
MATKDMVLEALRGVMDPELGLSVVDLGMIREVLISGEQVEVKMVLTAPFCPLADAITEDARQAIEALPGVREAKVTLLDEPRDPAWIKRGA